MHACIRMYTYMHTYVHRIQTHAYIHISYIYTHAHSFSHEDLNTYTLCKTHKTNQLTLYSWQTKPSHNNIHTVCLPLPQIVVTPKPTMYVQYTELYTKVYI